MKQVVNTWKEMNGGRANTHFWCGAQFPGPNNIWNLFVLVLSLLLAQSWKSRSSVKAQNLMF